MSNKNKNLIINNLINANYNKDLNPNLASFNIKSALIKPGSPKNSKTYTNNFFRKDLSGRIVSNNNRVINLENDRKINIQDMDEII